jgi:hypothetical protein
VIHEIAPTIRLDKAGLLVLAGAFLLTCMDMSGDYVLVFGVALKTTAGSTKYIVQSIVACLVGLLAIIAIVRIALQGNLIRLSRSAVTFLALLLSAVVLGLVAGFSNGARIRYLIGDARNYTILLGLLGIVGVEADIVVSRIRWALFLGIAFLVGKLFVATAGDVFLRLPLIARYYLRSSPLFLPVLFMSFSSIIDPRQDSENKWNVSFFVLSLLGIFMANTRGFYLGAIAGALAMCVCSRATRSSLLRVGLILGFIVGIALVVAVIFRGGPRSAFGTWNGMGFGAGLGYRARQVQSLMAMFAHHPVFGAGLGAFDPHYEGYAAWLPRPYIVELEFVNLLAKLGIVGFTLFVLSYLVLIARGFSLVWTTANPGQRSTVIGLTCGLVALMVASMTNTVYSSIQFHLYQLMVLAVFEGVALKIRPVGSGEWS